AVSDPVIAPRAARHAEQTAEKVEILDAGGNGQTFETAEAELHRILEPGLRARILESLGITALVAELQRIGRDFGNRNVLELAVIEQRLEPGGSAHAHVIVGRRNDELVGFEVLVEYELSGLRTFDPEVLRHFPAQEAADLRTNDVRDPIHGKKSVRLGHARARPPHFCDVTAFGNIQSPAASSPAMKR